MEIVSARPERYLKLAAYREQIELTNRKFRWPRMHMFDVQTRTRAASRKDIRLNVLDTTLYTTILDTSALHAHPKQCTRCKSFDHLVRDCPFSRRRSLKRRQNPRAPAPSSSERVHLTHGNSTSGSLLQDRRAATCTSENGAISATPVNEPTFAKLVGGTTPRLIAQALPEIKSPFNPQMWHTSVGTPGH